MQIPIVDSVYFSLEEALEGSSAPSEIRKQLKLISVSYISFDGRIHAGQMVIHTDLAREVEELFERLLEESFPIEKVIPVGNYGWDDEASMRDNNTSAFNYRHIIGTDVLSNHSHGRAIDINPMQNPYFARNGLVYPEGASYKPLIPGTLVKDGYVVSYFKHKGWAWLGERAENTDYQHFQKLS